MTIRIAIPAALGTGRPWRRRARLRCNRHPDHGDDGDRRDRQSRRRREQSDTEQAEEWQPNWNRLSFAEIENDSAPRETVRRA